MLFVSFSRRFFRAFALIAALTASVAAVRAQAPSAFDGFNPDVDGTVFAVATQADGKIVLGGQFTAVGGVPRRNLARLHPDGSLDDAFNPSALVTSGPGAGAVRALLLQGDGRILLGGDFNAIQGVGTTSPTPRLRLARLNADGTLDSSFTLGVTGDLLPQVHALLFQPDGRLVVGGSFTGATTAAATATSLPASTARNHLVRFTAAGAVDPTFNPNPNATVLALAWHVDNKLLVGGGFTSFQPAGDASPTTRQRIARLNPSGTVDSEFDPKADNSVAAIVVQRDGKILLGGTFSSLQPIGDTGVANRSRIARLNLDGTLDSEFYPRADGAVNTIVLQADGGILVGGSFVSVWGRGTNSSARSNIARFLPDASLDTTFAPGFNGAVNAIALQGDGKIVAGGVFTRATPPGSAAVLTRNRLARLNADGSIDADFALDSGGRVLVSVTQSDGKVVIGGSFTSVGGATRTYLARLNADGSIDSAYNPVLDGRVYAMAYEAASNKVVIAGAFTTIGGETRNHLARLNPSGTIDSEFNPNIDGQVGALAVQSDGKLIVGGSFTKVFPVGASAETSRANLLRLNANGTLDTAFDPSPNSSVNAIAVQTDGKIIIGGVFSALTPGFATNTSAAITSRNFLARLNSDGTLDTAYAPNPNAQISTLALQSDGKLILGGVFTTLQPDLTQTPTARNRIARLNTDGTLDAAYDPDANGIVLASALQTDGKLIIGGSFTSLQPNGASDWTLRKYAARLNADGTVDAAFNLDINEVAGNRVDSLRLAGSTLYVGGTFTSLQPAGTAARITRANFVRLTLGAATPVATVDTAFDASAGGAPGGTVNALAVQPDGLVIAVGNFSDLGGAKSTNVARYRPEGGADTQFSSALSVDGPVNAVVVRASGAPVPTQLAGFAWLNAGGTLRTAFAPSTRLSGEVNATATDSSGRLLLGGAFTNLSNTTGGNLVRLTATGAIDTTFNPAPNGAVTGIVVQADGRIVIVGTFTVVGGVTRNRIARIDANGSVDTTYDPSASARINAIVLQGDGTVVVAGAFTSFTPNLATTAVTRNYLARINVDGTVDGNYNPNANFNVHALALQADGKIVVGGSFSSLQPNGGTEAFTRNGIARLNPDGSLDQNFNPSANASVDAIVALPGGQFVIGGTFTTLQPGASGTVYSRNNLARINSDGAVDLTFNPNANAAVTTLALEAGGSLLVGGSFTTLQPNGAALAVTRNHLARLNADGTLDLNFNPDINGTIAYVGARPDGSVLVGGAFTTLQLNGSIMIGGAFGTVGGVAAQNLAMLNDNGSVTTTFQPRPNGAVHALLALPDGKTLVGGAFTQIAGVARNRLARFNADGTLDTAFSVGSTGTVQALALQPDGKFLVGGAEGLRRFNANGSEDATFAASNQSPITALAVQADGRVLYVVNRATLGRFNADGRADTTFTAPAGPVTAITLQTDGRIVVAGTASRLARLNPNGTVDPTFAPAPNGAVTALALQADGRLMVAGNFSRIGGANRSGLARLSASSPAIQTLGVAANRTSAMWSRAGTVGDVTAVIFERSTDRTTWTTLGNATRIAGTGNWQVTGISLPATGVFYLRARALAPSSAGTSSGIYESLREFTFSNPVPEAQASVGGPALTPVPPGTIPPPVVIVPPGTGSSLPPATGAAFIDSSTGVLARSVMSAVRDEGTVEIFVGAQTAAVAGGNARLANLSTRGRVTAENPLLLGFAIAGTESRRVLVRAVGPALNGFGVAGALPATRLQVYNSAGDVLAANEGWANAGDVAATAAVTGAFPLVPGSADSAAVLTLAPGSYTIQVVDARGAGGVALAEIYDAGAGTASRLVNVSSRGAAGTGSDALISGFVLAGDSSARVLVRGIGPGLAQFGAARTVADPLVALYDATGAFLGYNDNWVGSVNDVAAAAARTGAFALTPGSKDAAVLATIPTGAYTVQVSGEAGAAASALLEIYQLQ